MTRSSFILLFGMISLIMNAQPEGRYQFKEYLNALENQTRLLDGSPGAAYWQNTANYVIEAELFPEESLMRGSAAIDYTNNSPDTLHQLVFNLYQDIFRKGNSRDWDLGTDDLHEGTRINRLGINSRDLNLNDRRQVRRQGTQLVASVTLPPSSSVKVEVDWEVPIPSRRVIRMGQYSDSVFFIAYWYPQIAVYDDMDGWDRISYGGSVEFYNNFGDFDVKLKMPGDFVAWATGTLYNPEEVFHPEVYRRYQKAWESDEVVSIITQEGYENKAVTLANDHNIWHFVAEKVPDFSFGAALGYNWDAVSLVVDLNTGRRTLTDAVYPDGAIHYDRVAEFARQSIHYLSFVMPGVAFPYPQMTNFCNGLPGGGMETPMMANNSAPWDEADLYGLTLHEIAHSYFPFMMGTNEKKHAWMDEGWASLWPYVLVDSLYPDRKYVERSVAMFQAAAGVEMDIPPMVPNQLMGSDYAALRQASYVRPAMAFYFLEDAMGAELFLLALQAFMNEWEGKHPIPHDFFNTFERVAGEGLNWFFLPWFYETAFPDLAIHKVTKDRKVVITNEGGLPLPIMLELIYVDDSSIEIHYPTSIWKDAAKQVVIDIPGTLPVREIVLGNSRIPDINKRNNQLHIID